MRPLDNQEHGHNQTVRCWIGGVNEDFTIFTIVPVVLFKSQLMSVRELDARLQSDTFSYCACSPTKIPSLVTKSKGNADGQTWTVLGRGALAC